MSRINSLTDLGVGTPAKRHVTHVTRAESSTPKIKLIIFSFSFFYPHIKMAQDSTDMMNNSFIDEMLKLQDEHIQSMNSQ